MSLVSDSCQKCQVGRVPGEDLGDRGSFVCPFHAFQSWASVLEVVLKWTQAFPALSSDAHIVCVCGGGGRDSPKEENPGLG